jgi:hypothetical protein
MKEIVRLRDAVRMPAFRGTREFSCHHWTQPALSCRFDTRPPAIGCEGLLESPSLLGSQSPLCLVAAISALKRV